MTRRFFYYFWCMIDRETVDRILDAADIVDVIGDFVTLRRRGANYIACCLPVCATSMTAPWWINSTVAELEKLLANINED